jgi:16S rRNA (adenine1518-N6/adenine1519-N6)-dimethyltransferase
VTRPKKSLGQNFLNDSTIARRIVRSLSLRRTDRVLEVGPGTGALTGILLGEVDRLSAIEIDDELTLGLKKKFGSALTLYHDDILHLEVESIAKAMGGKIRIVGNIPYNITTPILFWIIDASVHVSDCTLMMQREVALRLVAKPRTKEYGILSIFAQYYATPSLLFTVAPGAFTPVPEVTSAVVSLNFENQRIPAANDDTVFRSIVRGTFGKRRKTLRNGLRSLELPLGIFEALPLDLNRRPEELSVQEFVTLANAAAAHTQNTRTEQPV